jgi:hypothetical protein
MNESNIKGVSIRGIISFVVIMALCWACIYKIDDIKVGILKDIAIMILSYYFGQKSSPTSTTVTTPNVSISSNSGDLNKPSGGVVNVQP